jgi:hypothetical protein
LDIFSQITGGGKISLQKFRLAGGRCEALSHLLRGQYNSTPAFQGGGTSEKTGVQSDVNMIKSDIFSNKAVPLLHAGIFQA